MTEQIGDETFMENIRIQLELNANDIEYLTNENEKLQKDNSEMHESLSAKIQETTEAKGQILTMSDKIKELEETVNELRIKNSTAAENLERYKRNLGDVTNKKTQIENEHAKEMKVYTSQIDSLRTKLERYEQLSAKKAAPEFVKTKSEVEKYLTGLSTMAKSPKKDKDPVPTVFTTEVFGIIKNNTDQDHPFKNNKVKVLRKNGCTSFYTFAAAHKSLKPNAYCVIGNCHSIKFDGFLTDVMNIVFEKNLDDEKEKKDE